MAALGYRRELHADRVSYYHLINDQWCSLSSVCFSALITAANAIYFLAKQNDVDDTVNEDDEGPREGNGNWTVHNGKYRKVGEVGRSTTYARQREGVPLVFH